MLLKRQVSLSIYLNMYTNIKIVYINNYILYIYKNIKKEMQKLSFKVSNKLKNQLKKRLASATAILAVLVLVFACSKINLIKENIELDKKQISQNASLAGNEIEIIKDSAGINLRLHAEDSNGINKIEVYQDSEKIKEDTYSDGASNKIESIGITIPFGETQTITLKVNNEIVAQKDIKNSRYIITVNDLVRFRNEVNAGDTYAGKYVDLLSDLNLSSVCYRVDGSMARDISWTSIGNDSYNFCGNFNGNHHTIRGLYFNTSNSNCRGLFGTIGVGGVVQGITLRDGSGNFSVTPVGMISGANSGVIKDCMNHNPGTTGNTYYSMGGMTGFNYGTIMNCGNTATMYGYDTIGGIAGANMNGTIRNCFNRGNITATYSVAGGIAGHNGIGGTTSYIYNCYNIANVGQVEVSGGIAGGCGWTNGRGYIYNSYTLKKTNKVVHEYQTFQH